MLKVDVNSKKDVDNIRLIGKRMELHKILMRIDERYIVRQFAFLQKHKLNQ